MRVEAARSSREGSARRLPPSRRALPPLRPFRWTSSASGESPEPQRSTWEAMGRPGTRAPVAKKRESLGNQRAWRRVTTLWVNQHGGARKGLSSYPELPPAWSSINVRRPLSQRRSSAGEVASKLMRTPCGGEDSPKLCTEKRQRRAQRGLTAPKLRRGHCCASPATFFITLAISERASRWPEETSRFALPAAPSAGGRLTR